MEYTHLKEIWLNDESPLSDIYSFKKTNLNNLGITAQTIDFLVNVGLPEQAAPFLNFKERLNPVTESYPFLDNSFNPLIEIGFDGSGNPIVINTTKNDIIELLDHEDEFSPMFMNSSIETLFYFLLYYRVV